MAFTEINWHDYAIVQTIEFTAVDANSKLPPPMNVQEVENMTLAQKRMVAMIMENTVDDVEAVLYTPPHDLPDSGGFQRILDM